MLPDGLEMRLNSLKQGPHTQLCRLRPTQYHPHLSGNVHTTYTTDMYVHDDNFLEGLVEFLVLRNSVFYNNILTNRSKVS